MWTEKNIKNLSSKEYFKHRNAIKKFYNSLRNLDTKSQMVSKSFKKQKININILHVTDKECRQCLDIKKLSDFSYSSYTKDNKSIYCKKCSADNMKFQLKINKKLKLGSILRNRINNALKFNHKSASTIRLLGCSIEYFKKHIELSFKPGMTWYNYGNKKGIKCWEIDHIKPCCSFDLSKPEEQRKCFHWSNMQALWVIENRQKSNK